MSKVALVTGANRGIGFAIAQKLHGEGFTVVGTHRSSPAEDAKYVSQDVMAVVLSYFFVLPDRLEYASPWRGKKDVEESPDKGYGN